MAKKKPNSKNVRPGQTLWEVVPMIIDHRFVIIKHLITEKLTKFATKKEIQQTLATGSNHNWFRSVRKATKRVENLVIQYKRHLHQDDITVEYWPKGDRMKK